MRGEQKKKKTSTKSEDTIKERQTTNKTTRNQVPIRKKTNKHEANA